MNPKLLELATRHGALKARIDEQRRVLAHHSVPLEAALAHGDAVLKGVDWLKHHPVAVGIAVSVAVIARPRRALRWARRGFFLWRGWRAIRTTLIGAR
ncbi:MAG: YqjK-like family protein [Azonexus sp.]